LPGCEGLEKLFLSKKNKGEQEGIVQAELQGD